MVIDSKAIKSAEKHTGSVSPEQELCLICGMCCDGTLFDNANVEPGEKDYLPQEIRKKYYREGENERFRLPCTYFKNRCLIYDTPRTASCRKFRCELIQNLSGGKINKDEAFRVVHNSRTLRSEIFLMFSQLFKEYENRSYREVADILGKNQAGGTVNGKNINLTDLLIAKCNIFDVLLMRHFKPEKYLQQITEAKQNNSNENERIHTE